MDPGNDARDDTMSWISRWHVFLEREKTGMHGANAGHDLQEMSYRFRYSGVKVLNKRALRVLDPWIGSPPEVSPRSQKSRIQNILEEIARGCQIELQWVSSCPFGQLVIIQGTHGRLIVPSSRAAIADAVPSPLDVRCTHHIHVGPDQGPLLYTLFPSLIGRLEVYLAEVIV